MRRHRSCSKERIISISPSRRSELPFRSLNIGATDVGSTNRPAKMVSVPVFTDNPSQEQIDRGETDPLRYRRKSLAEIDNNAGRTPQSSNPKMVAMVPPRTRRLSRDLDMKYRNDI
ncbi:unnamed protein product [Lactuca virosa]|uniref:Uncharacterized protein n=1 Tax=Lactuca virosa TaxID=75947 RepID=A0AAU9LW16_9ASTR|nr:unnamed protein product [Lactuca virosa]